MTKETNTDYSVTVRVNRTAYPDGTTKHYLFGTMTKPALVCMGLIMKSAALTAVQDQQQIKQDSKTL